MTFVSIRFSMTVSSSARSRSFTVTMPSSFRSAEVTKQMYIVSLSSPMRRMRAMDSRTLIYFFRSMNSAVIMLPAEFSG